MFDILVGNPFYGEHAKKDLIPREYKEKYDVHSLFIADLPNYHRMIYTLESDELETTAFIIDILTHNEYDKKFGFKRR